MYSRLIGAQLILIQFAGLVLTICTHDQDVALVIAAIFTMVYGGHCEKSGAVRLTRNLPIFMALMLLAVLGAYRVMFELTEVQSYIDDTAVVRADPVFIGATLIQLLLLGAFIGTFVNRPSLSGLSQPFTRIDPVFLEVIAWIPIFINIAAYVLVFRSLDYVEVHTASRGAGGLFLKSIYITYGAMILLALSDNCAQRSYSSVKRITVGCFLAFGLLFQLRSPLLFALLIFAYFYGHKFRFLTLVLAGVGAVVGFAVIGIVRDPNSLSDGTAMARVLTPVLGLGEFVDTLRFAINYVNNGSSLFGSGIIGSFLGTAEPVANVYARMIAPDYFDEGGGFGFFFLADLVINFGEAGACAVIVAMGYAIAYIYARHGYSNRSLILPILYANVFAFVRNDFGSTFRGVLYVLIAVAFIRASWILYCKTKRYWNFEGAP